MATKLEVSKGDLAFEAGFPKPEFGLFRDGAALLDCLYRRLEPHGLRLPDIRFERGAGNVGDQHFVIYLFDYLMTVRIRVERIEVHCSHVPQELLEQFKAAIVDVLRAVKDHRPELPFRAFAVAVGFHAKLEGTPVRDYLAQFVTNVPQKLGPSTGAGAVFYFGAEGDRQFATVTADVSAAVPNGLFVRIHSAWDGGRVAPDALAGVADAFVRQVLNGLGLELPV